MKNSTGRKHSAHADADKPAAPATWQALLDDAVENPGTIHAAYTAFHNYSLGNQVLAMFQCMTRGITPGPIATFKRWQEMGRSVRKGEHALQLCRPTGTFRRTVTDDVTGEETTVQGATRFAYPRAWFVLDQTDGPSVPEFTPAADWTVERATASLDISTRPFDHLNGNVQGYSTASTITVSPLAFNPTKTAIHEMAHVVLRHTEQADRYMREVEAESVALLVLAALGLPGAEHARGYIQEWNHGTQRLSEDTCRRVFSAADKILTAGRVATPEPVEA